MHLYHLGLSFYGEPMSGLIETASLPSLTPYIETRQIQPSHMLYPISGLSFIEGQTFLIEDNSVADTQTYDKSNIIDTVAEILFEIDLDTIPKGLKLSEFVVSILEEDEHEYADELCVIISTWNSIEAVRKLTASPAHGLEQLGTYKVQDQKTVQLFSIHEQDYRRPRLRRFCVIVCKRHRDLRV